MQLRNGPETCPDRDFMSYLSNHKNKSKQQNKKQWCNQMALTVVSKSQAEKLRNCGQLYLFKLVEHLGMKSDFVTIHILNY